MLKDVLKKKYRWKEGKKGEKEGSEEGVKRTKGEGMKKERKGDR